MDENVVFKPTPKNQPNQPTQPQEPVQGPKLTVQDLYGPSTPQSGQQPVSQKPPQPAAPIPQAPPPVSQTLQQPFQQPKAPQMQPAQQPPPPVLQPQPSMYPPPPPVPPLNAAVPPPPLPGFSNNPVRGKIVKIVIGIVLFLLILGIGSMVYSRFGQKPETGAAVTLTYWGLWEENKTMQVLIDDFQRNNPTIKVVYQKQDPELYKERVLARSDTGNGPDILTYHNTWLPTMRNVLLPLPQDVVTPEEFKKTYYPVVHADLIHNGAIYGIPQGIDTLALFVNKDIFDAAGIGIPQTWDEFIRAAKTLTVKDETGAIKTAGAAMGTYDNVTHAPDLLSLLFVQNGVNLSAFSNAQPLIADTLTFYTAFALDRESVWNGSLTPARLAFANGELAMYFGYSWEIPVLFAANPNLVFTIHPAPNLPTKQISIASYWVNGVSNKSKFQKEALLFTKYLAQKEVAQKLYTESAKLRTYGTPYARVDLAETLSDNPFLYPFVLQAPYATSSYFASETQDKDYNTRLNEYLGNAVRSMQTGVSADSAAETLINGVAQVRSLYGQ